MNLLGCPSKPAMINRQIVDISRNLSLKAKIPFAYLKTFRATLLESVDFDRLFYWFRFVSPRKAMSTEKSLFSRKRLQVITRFERFQGIAGPRLRYRTVGIRPL